MTYLHGKTVLVTGAAGTIGSALLPVLASNGVAAIRALDHGESELFHVFERYRNEFKTTPLVGDIRDLERLRMAMSGVDIVFHAAALKHVELGEYNPFEVVETNLRGLDNVIRAALDASVEKVVFTSSDKAVNPTNVMGASKMMGERIVTAANDIRGSRRTRFSAVRFGNVLGSRGSVLPLFAEAAAAGEPLKLTHPEMTRYVMTIETAAQLVVEAADLMQGGEVFVTKMRALRIADLARAIVNLLSRGRSNIVHTKPKMGEKLFEELLSQDEVGRTYETERMLIVLSARDSTLANDPRLDGYGIPLTMVTREWHSGKEECMSQAEIEQFLVENNLLRSWSR